MDTLKGQDMNCSTRCCTTANNRLQRTALRAAAELGRYADMTGYRECMAREYAIPRLRLPREVK